jgi:hypothetical protein
MFLSNLLQIRLSTQIDRTRLVNHQSQDAVVRPTNKDLFVVEASYN